MTARLWLAAVVMATDGPCLDAMVRVKPTYASKTRLVAASPAQPR